MIFRRTETTWVCASAEARSVVLRHPHRKFFDAVTSVSYERWTRPPGGAARPLHRAGTDLLAPRFPACVRSGRMTGPLAIRFDPVRRDYCHEVAVRGDVTHVERARARGEEPVLLLALHRTVRSWLPACVRRAPPDSIDVVQCVASSPAHLPVRLRAVRNVHYAKRHVARGASLAEHGSHQVRLDSKPNTA